MRILIVGAGAIGGYLGARLVAGGRDVTFLVRPRRAEQLKRHGLVVSGARDSITVTPKIVFADQLAADYDLVILAVKSYALEGAITEMAPAGGPDTAILPILNGMQHLDVLGHRFGRQSVLAGLCMIATTLDAEGRIIQLFPRNELTFGEIGGGVSKRVERISECFQGCDLLTYASADVMLDMWEKWFLLASMGAVCCLMRGTIGDIMEAAGGFHVVNALIDEIRTIISAVGRTPRDETVAFVRSALTEVGATKTSSMYRDLKDGKPIEADQIIGDLLMRGQRVDIRSPLLQATYANLTVYQAQIARIQATSGDTEQLSRGSHESSS